MSTLAGMIASRFEGEGAAWLDDTSGDRLAAVAAEVVERMLPSARALDLAEIALESAAQSCQSGATLTGRGVDPLAREYLQAASAISALRVRTYGADA